MLLLLLCAVAVGATVAPPASLSVHYEVVEEQPTGTLIGNLVSSAQLANYYSAELLSGLSFGLMEHSARYEQLVSVSDEGDLRVREPLDRDVLCSQQQCVLQLDFALQPLQDFNNMLSVTLVVLDINDNAPTFWQPSIELSLSESVSVGAELRVRAATDLDSELHSVHSYRLLQTDDVFELSSQSSDHVTLVLRRPVDRESVETYTMTVSGVGQNGWKGWMYIHDDGERCG